MRRADATREALLDSALREFALRGFDGASTTSIAARAGTHQPQINYHFGSKRALWEATVDHLFDRLDDEMRAAPPVPADLAPEGPGDFVAVVWRFVHAAARLPELNRVMVHEAMAASDRLDWIVERHTRDRFDQIATAWSQLVDAGSVERVDEMTLYYALVGAASLRFVNDAEARRLRPEISIDDRAVAGHARFVIRAILAGAGR
jgi:AcrR family transcriptional regulator